MHDLLTNEPEPLVAIISGDPGFHRLLHPVLCHVVVVVCDCGQTISLTQPQVVFGCGDGGIFLPTIFLDSSLFPDSEQYNLSKRDQLAKDKPDINHLDIGSGGQLLIDTDEDCGQHQHGRQVHTQGSFKKHGLEECGGIGDRDQ